MPLLILFYKAFAVAVLLYLRLSSCLQRLTTLAFAVTLYTELDLESIDHG